jgi:structural maintenance of chromosome 2
VPRATEEKQAAGTSMFEEKKDKAVKTMSKKEKKLEEIQSLLKEERVACSGLW